jgi:hypothetical protein
MKSEPKSPYLNVYLTIVGVLAFYTAAAIYFWKLIDEGARLTTAVPAVCFPMAAAIWTQIVVRLIRGSRSKKGGSI